MDFKNINMRNIVLYVLGIITLALGIVFSLISGFGAGSWDALNSNISEVTNISVGNVLIIQGIVLILISALLSKTFPRILSIFTGLLLGVVVDFWFVFLATPDELVFKLLYLALAILLIPLGIAFLISSKFPPSPIDVFLLAVKDRFDLGFDKAKYIIEAIAFLSAILVGYLGVLGVGNIHIGTVVMIFTVGIILNQYMKIINKLIDEEN